MSKKLLIDAVYSEETRVVICEDGKVQDFDYETTAKKQLKGNIYLGKITRVEPSLQAAFVDYGGDRHGFLPFAEIHPDYYQIPVSDREDAEDAEGSDSQEESAAATEDAGLPPHVVKFPVESSEEEQKEDASDAQVEEASQAEAESEEESDLSDDDQVIEESGDTDTDDIDALDDDAEEGEDNAKRLQDLCRRYKIQEVIKRNQVILVQVIKEERGNKGASLTSYLSLAGRYCVLMPNTLKKGGVSRRITDPDARRRLKEVISGLPMPEGASVILRTAGAERNKQEIKRDYDYLIRLWDNIREHTLSSIAPAFIHAEGDVIKRSIRDLYNNSIDEVLIQGEGAYKQAKGFMKLIMPSHASRVKNYRHKTPIFSRHQVEEQLSGLYNQVATLSSGGYLVLNPTEALISIDVNSGRSTSERNIEETAIRTNIEAAKEIARQLRLRDLSGLIVIDFIDMLESKNRRAVERALRDALRTDRAKIQIGRISPFGLLEMSRQRLRSSFLESNTITCPSCNGRGIVRAPEATAVMVLRAITSEVCGGDTESMNIYAHQDTIIYILNHKRKELAALEETYKVSITFHQDEDAGRDGFATEKIRRVGSDAKKNKPSFEADNLLYEEAEEGAEAQADSDSGSDADGDDKNKKRNWKQSSNDNRSGRRSRRSSGNNRGRRGNNRRSSQQRQGGQGQKKQDTKSSDSKSSSSDDSKPKGDKDTSLLKGLWRKIID